ncbi:DUF6195 family protein [Streptomyces tauricus]
MTTHDLIAAAQAAHADYLNDQAIDKATEAAMVEESRADFLREAAEHAVNILGPTAEDLHWIGTPEQDLPEHHYAATAALPPGRVHDVHLNLRFDAFNGVHSLALVRTCRSCTDQLTDTVDSLADLGRLLDDGPARDETAATRAPEPGPLRAVDQAQQRAASIAALARRIITKNPDAALTIESAYAFGHDDGGGRAELRFNAEDLTTLHRVAASLGVDVTERVSGTHKSMVLRHGAATYMVDGIEVQLRGYDRLPDDQAAAWLAQQNQPAAEASDGGDV